MARAGALIETSGVIVGQQVCGSGAMREAQHLADVLTESYGARRVCLPGSLAKSRAVFTASSDIDLAVEGLPQDCLHRALGDLMVGRAFTVDVKPLEDVPDSFRLRIAEEGVPLSGEENPASPK